MKDFLTVLGKAPLFSGIAQEEITPMLACLGAKEQTYEKGRFILCAGDAPEAAGLLLSGKALIVQEDFWGNRNILASLSPSELFAESFACSPGVLMNVSVLSEEPCRVLWLHVSRILSVCPKTCARHSRVIGNLLSALAAKNLRLNERMTHMGQRSTREKVLSFLSVQAQRQGKNAFDIVFDRQQLADYLSVERSALSAELSKLRKEGVIDFHKNHFVLAAGGNGVAAAAE